MNSCFGMLLGMTLAQDSVPSPPALNASAVRPDPFATRTHVVPSTRSFSGHRAVLFASHVRDPLVFRPDSSDEVIAIVGPVWGLTGGLGWARGPLAIAATLPAQFAIGSDLHDGRPASALGDIAVDTRVVARDASKAPVGVAGQLRLTAPLGGDVEYMGQPGFTWEMLAVGEVASAGWSLTSALGFRGVPEVKVGGESLDDLLVYRLGTARSVGEGGAAIELLGQRQLRGFFDELTNSPMEVVVGGWRHLDPENQHALRAGLGWGINPGIGSPQVRLLVGINSLEGERAETSSQQSSTAR